MSIITETRTTKSLSFNTSVNKNVEAAKGPPPSIVEEIVKQDKEQKWAYEEGVIKLVLPSSDKVEVAVEPIFHPNREDTTFMSTFAKPMYYNTQFEPRYSKGKEGVPFLQCFIPLVNFDATTGQDLNSLIDKHVRVKVWDKKYASEAELLAWSKYERAYKSGISVYDMFIAEKYDLEAGSYLKSIGYTDKEIEEYLDLKIQDVLEENKGVIRLKNEAYWDKDVLELSQHDILVEKWPETLKRNLQPLKDKLCHMPLIMFTGK